MAEQNNNILLQVSGLKVGYGGIQAVKGIDFEVRTGELVSLIGSNGAGKTTTMKAITGTLTFSDGDIRYQGESIRGQGAWDLVKKGLVMVPEGRGVFARMTIVENLQMGAFIRRDKAGILADIDRMFALFPRLKERRDQLAGTMSGGEQQMLAMGRALMSQPRLLLLDEPLEGLAPLIRLELLNAFKRMSADLGITVVVVEQQVQEVLRYASQALIMEHGMTVHCAAADHLLDDNTTLERYVGVAVH